MFKGTFSKARETTSFLKSFDGIGHPTTSIAAGQLRLVHLARNLLPVVTFLPSFSLRPRRRSQLSFQLAPPQFMAVAAKHTTPDARHTPSVCHLSAVPRRFTSP